MRLPLGLLVLVLVILAAGFAIDHESPCGLDEPIESDAGGRAAMDAELIEPSFAVGAADRIAGTVVLPPVGVLQPSVTPMGVHGSCVEALSLAGLVLEGSAKDADFERVLGPLARADRVVLRHRIRKLFAAGHEDPPALRALVVSAEEIDLLACELRWLSANLAAETADPFAVLRVAPVPAAAEDPDSIARRYAGVCDEELARELDALERALAVENDRGLDERIALGQYRVRQQPGEF